MGSWLLNIASFAAWAVLLAALWQSCEESNITQPSMDKLPASISTSGVLKDAGWTDSSYSKLGIVKHGDNYDKILRNHSYLHAFRPSPVTKDSLETVLSQVITQVVSGAGELQIPSIKTTAYSFSKGRMGDVLWEMEAPGINGEIFNGFYRVERKECCGLGKLYALYNLTSGQKIISYSNSYLKLEAVDGSAKRLLGLKSGASSYLEIYEEDPLYIGTLSYSSMEGELEIAVLMAKDSLSKSKLENSLSLNFLAPLSANISQDVIFGERSFRVPPQPAEGSNYPLCTVSLNLEPEEKSLSIEVYSDSLGLQNLRENGLSVDIINPMLPVSTKAE